MTEELFQKALREREQLVKMGKDGAFEVLKGYHSQIIKLLSDCMENVSKIVEMSAVW